MPRRTSGSPPVTRIRRVPIPMKTAASRASSSSDRTSGFGRNTMSSAMQ